MCSSKERIEAHTGNTGHYAFDAATGKEFFSSGHVFVTTFDNTLYSFGLKQ